MAKNGIKKEKNPSLKKLEKLAGELSVTRRSNYGARGTDPRGVLNFPKDPVPGKDAY